MTEIKPKPKKKSSKKNLGAFMVKDPEEALKDVKKKESEKETDEQ